MLNKSLVTFTNEPKYSEHEVDAKYNTRRKNLSALMPEFIRSHVLFTGVPVSVTFMHRGVASLVSVLDTGTTKYVLKIPLKEVDSKLEATFLKAWENVGVKVPHVFEEGEIGGHWYTLMEFINAETLSEKFKKEGTTGEGTYRKLGAILRHMHQVKTKGYSNIVNKKHEPEYSNVTDWFAGDKIMQDQIAWVRQENLYPPEECGSIDQALQILKEKLGDSDETIYCHNDFGAGNMFATEPYTVFDPWPSFQHPYMDLARAIWSTLRHSKKMSEQYIEGYFGDEACDRKLLHAFIFITAYVKSKYMAQTGGKEGVVPITEYLKANKHYLD